MTHTPTPWSVAHKHIYKRDWKQEHGQWIDHAIGDIRTGPTEEENVANAAYIVQAVNHHAALVEALELIADAYVGPMSAEGQLEAVTKVAQKALAALKGGA